MEEVTLGTIAKWVEGKLRTSPEITVNKVVIDSRKAGGHSLFFCFKGKKTDGHYFIEEVKEKGAYVIGEKDICDIVVRNAVKALGRMAEEYRRMFPAKAISVTGSNGKTTVAGMISNILKNSFDVISTPKSFNNNIGVPLTLFDIENKTEIAVIETGANHAGEVRELCRIIKPDMGVITNVGDAHIGFFGSRENILLTKFELADYLTEGSVLVYNFDQREVREKAASYNDLDLCGFGFEKGADIRGELLKTGAEGSSFKCLEREFHIKIPGNFNVYNALSAVAVTYKMGVAFKDISEGLISYSAQSHRMKRLKQGEIEIIDDSYNASPSSIKQLFGDLLKIYSQKNIIAVLGEMLELGEQAEKLHRKTGSVLAKLPNVKYIVAGGSFSDYYIKGAIEEDFKPDCLYKFKTKKEAAEIIRKLYKKDYLVVLKASRQQKLEEVLEFLK